MKWSGLVLDTKTLNTIGAVYHASFGAALYSDPNAFADSGMSPIKYTADAEGPVGSFTGRAFGAMMCVPAHPCSTSCRLPCLRSATSALPSLCCLLPAFRWLSHTLIGTLPYDIHLKYVTGLPWDRSPFLTTPRRPRA